VIDPNKKRTKNKIYTGYLNGIHCGKKNVFKIKTGYLNGIHCGKERTFSK